MIDMADTSLQTKLIGPISSNTARSHLNESTRSARPIEFARSFMDLGEEKLLDTIKFWTASVGDYLNEYFETDVIKAHMAGSGIIGTALGVYSPGTAYVLLHHYMGDVDGNVGAWGFARGGMGAIADALQRPSNLTAGKLSATPTSMKSSSRTAAQPVSRSKMARNIAHRLCFEPGSETYLPGYHQSV